LTLDLDVDLIDTPGLDDGTLVTEKRLLQHRQQSPAVTVE
jgi:hypothetical protein